VHLYADRRCPREHEMIFLQATIQGQRACSPRRSRLASGIRKSSNTRNGFLESHDVRSGEHRISPQVVKIEGAHLGPQEKPQIIRNDTREESSKVDAPPMRGSCRIDDRGSTRISPMVADRRTRNHFALGYSETEQDSMSASIPEVTFTPRANGDGTWYVEVASPGIACEDIGDFRSKASAEAWIRDVRRGHVATGASEVEASLACAKTADGDVI
jgi:hypothetical protein